MLCWGITRMYHAWSQKRYPFPICPQVPYKPPNPIKAVREHDLHNSAETSSWPATRAEQATGDTLLLLLLLLLCVLLLSPFLLSGSSSITTLSRGFAFLNLPDRGDWTIITRRPSLLANLPSPLCDPEFDALSSVPCGSDFCWQRQLVSGIVVKLYDIVSQR